MTKSLPVLLYHYVCKKEDSIAVHPEIFEAHCLAMAEAGYRGVDLDEAVHYLARGKALPRGSVLISFDDGFLDNWVYAWPALKAHGHQAVVFAVAGRLESRTGLRPTLENLRQGRTWPQDLPQVDDTFVRDEAGFLVRQDPFLSWDEARAMEASGVMRLGAHSLWHDSVFRPPKPSEFPTVEGLWDFHRPGPRPRTFDHVSGGRPYGLPPLDTGPALATRAFLLSDEFLDRVRSAVPQETATAHAFFQSWDGARHLQRNLEDLPLERWGRLEREDEYRARVATDLAWCRDTLTRELGQHPEALAWPWGKSTPEARAIARDLGFTVFFDTTFGPNPPGQWEHVHRFKARPKGPNWLTSRLWLYSRPWAAQLYAAVRI